MTPRRRREGSLPATPHSRLLLLLLLLLLPGTVLAQNRFPAEIHLNAAVLHAPPFATVEPQPDGTLKYGGFQPDLLERLTVFAAADNVTLHWNLSQAPDQYGTAFDLVADDCETVVANQSLCHQLDLIVGNFYATPDRALRVNLSPAWMRSSISSIKYLNKNGTDYTTLTQATIGGATACLKDGTFYAGVVKAKFPKLNFFMCASQDDCLAALKREDCVLYVSDELELRYRVAWDYTLEVTRESFNTQYIAWPRSNRLQPIVTILLNRWILAAVTNTTLDELYHKYFQKALCPVGTAGESCQLPCDPDHGASNEQGVCVCHSTKWTGNDCSIEVPENTNNIPSKLKYLAYAMFAFNCVLILGFGAWLMWQRKSTQVLVSQPFFLSLVLLGCLISSSTILALGQEDEGEGPVKACMAIPWLYSVGFCVTFGTLFAKIRRVFVIFRSAVDMRRNVVTVQETLIIIGVVLMIDVVLLVIWTTVDPLHWERTVIQADQFGVPLESEGHCTSDHWMVFAGVISAFHLLLLAIACYCCYVSRGIPTKFSEGKFVSVAMISNLQIFIVGLPILVVLGADSAASFFVRAVVVWMNDFVVITLIFGNLIYSVHWDKDDSNNQTVKAAAGHAIRQYSKSMRSNFSSRQADSSRQMDASATNLALDAGSGHSGSRSREFILPPFGAATIPVTEGRRRSSGSRISLTRYQEERIPPMIIEGSMDTGSGRSSRDVLLSGQSSTHPYDDSVLGSSIGRASRDVLFSGQSSSYQFDESHGESSAREDESKCQEVSDTGNSAAETPGGVNLTDIFTKSEIDSSSFHENSRDTASTDATPSEWEHKVPAAPQMKLSPAPSPSNSKSQEELRSMLPLRTLGKWRNSDDLLVDAVMGAMADTSARSERSSKQHEEAAKALEGSLRNRDVSLEHHSMEFLSAQDHDRHFAATRAKGKPRSSLQKLDDQFVEAMGAMADSSGKAPQARQSIDKELAEALEGSSGNLQRALERNPSENETDQTSGFFELDDDEVERGAHKPRRKSVLQDSSEETLRTSGTGSFRGQGPIGNGVSVGHA